MRSVWRIIVVLLAAVALPIPAWAAPGDDAAFDAVIELQGEIMLLVELDAFAGEVPADLTTIHRQNERFMRGLSRVQLLGWLAEKDAAGADALGRVEAAGIEPSAAVVAVLGRLSDTDRSAVEAGGDVSLDAPTYVQALLDLNLRNGEGSSDAPTPKPSAVPAPASSAGPAVTEPAPSGDSSLPLGIVALVVVVAGAVAAFAVRRRRPAAVPESPDGEDRMARLLDAGRRMTKALDRDPIARIACEEGLALADGRHAAFVIADETGTRLLCATEDGLIDERRVGEGTVARVVETGQPFRAVVTDEPMLTALPVAMLAVPVIVGGRVTGVLVIVRDDATPFSDAEHDAVLRLAPMVGSALDAAARHDGVTEMTMVDGLTGLANRRRLDRDLPEALAWADATEGSVGFVMIDVDHFKTFNDTHGHAEGDRVLRTVGDLIRLNVREGDVVYRYGGEEFSVLLRDTTRDEVLSVAERIRAAVAGAGIEGGETQPAGAVTVSVGLALVDGGDPEACMTAADGALYDAKHAGRDRVAFAG